MRRRREKAVTDEFSLTPSEVTEASEKAKMVADQQRIQSVIDYLRYGESCADGINELGIIEIIQRINTSWQRELVKEIKTYFQQFAAESWQVKLGLKFISLCDPVEIELADASLSSLERNASDRAEQLKMERLIKSVMDYIKTDKNVSDLSRKEAVVDLANQITFPYQRLLARELITFIEQPKPARLWRFAVSFFCEDPNIRIKLAREFLEGCHPDADLSARKWLLSEQQRTIENDNGGSVIGLQ